MYLRLARTPGFRALPCALATLMSMARVFAHRATAARRRRRRVLASCYTLTGRIFRLAGRAASRRYGRGERRKNQASNPLAGKVRP
jgi:hypothetical protein